MQGVYLQGLREGVTDWGKKHAYYTGGLDRESLIKALREKDEELLTALAAIDAQGAESFSIDWYGSEINLTRYLSVWIQHEALHQGQWSFYATLGGFPTPQSWVVNWGL